MRNAPRIPLGRGSIRQEEGAKILERVTANHFIKSLGSADEPMLSDWVDVHPEKLSAVHFAKEPKSIRVGDLFVCYAAVQEKLLGVVEVSSPPQFNPQYTQWPYFCEVRPKLIIREIDRAPSLDALNAADRGRAFRRAVPQMDYAVLEDAEWESAVAALEAAWDRTKGDLGSPRTNSTSKT